MTTHFRPTAADAEDRKLYEFRDSIAGRRPQSLLLVSQVSEQHAPHDEQAERHSCRAQPRFDQHCHAVPVLYGGVPRPGYATNGAIALVPVRIASTSRHFCLLVPSSWHALPAQVAATNLGIAPHF